VRFITVLLILFSAALPPHAGVAEETIAADPAEIIIASIGDDRLRLLLSDVLSRNPRLAVLRARARAAAEEPVRVGALPDPTLSAVFFLSEPQTRVGPQQGSLTVMQALPGAGKRDLKSRAATAEAVVARAVIGSEELRLLTRTRRLYHELQYRRSERKILLGDIRTLERFEEMARARYASGRGGSQAVIKIQAEITRTRSRILGIDSSISDVIEEINVLRDLPGGTAVQTGELPLSGQRIPAFDALHARAATTSPEISAARATIDAAASRAELADRSSRPDFTVGLSYSLIGRRDDRAGKLNPPEGNGRDVLGLIGGISLPVWRKALDAEAEGAIQRKIAAEYGLRERMTSVDGEISALARRIPLILEQLALFENTLRPQAEASLASAEGAYATATASVLDLLDAERTLLRVRVSTEKTRSDLAIAIAELEGAAAGPLADINSTTKENGAAS